MTLWGGRVSVSWYKGGNINRVMDVIVSQEPYAFSNIRTTQPIFLLTADGMRITYTPSSPPNERIIRSLKENRPHSRILYPECCAMLLSHLLPRGGRILDIAPGNTEFAIASHLLPSTSYVGVDPGEELGSVLLKTGIDTERVAYVNTLEDTGEEPYDLVITSISKMPEEKMSDECVIIVRDTEGIDIFKQCWFLGYPQIYGIIGIRHHLGACDAVALLSKQKGRIVLPESTTRGRLPFLQRIEANPISERGVASLVSYGGKRVPYLGGNPYACIQFTEGMNGRIGILLKAGVFNPLTFLSLYNPKYEGARTDLHLFEYGADIVNRTIVFLYETMSVSIHSYSNYTKAVEHAKYIIGNDDDILGKEEGSEGEDIAIESIGSGIGKLLGYEHTFIEIRGQHDLLAKGVGKVYPRADIRVSMASCDPSTLSHLQSTRDGSNLYFTSDIGKKTPSLIVDPVETDVGIRPFTTDELREIILTNTGQYLTDGARAGVEVGVDEDGEAKEDEILGGISPQLV